MNIHDIIKDSKGFSDELIVPITGSDGTVVEVPLKELRNKFRASDADYTRKAQELAAQRQQFEDQKLQWAQQQNARPDSPVSEPALPRGGDELDELFRPVFDKVYSKYDPALKTIETLQQELRKRDQDMLNSMTLYADREIRRMYQSLPEKPTTDDGRVMDAKEFARYAVSKGYVDPQGFPDFDRASNDYFGPTRMENQLKEAREAGRKEAMEEAQRAAFMPKPNIRKSISMGEEGKAAPNQQAAPPRVAASDVPGINRIDRAPQKNTRSRGVFNEALSEALNDPSIREGLYNLNRG